jgi:type IV secretory pathway VirJ component
MKNFRLAALACALMLVGASAGAAETIEYPGLGPVTIYQPAGAPTQVVVFVSGDGGWNLGVVSMARHLVAAGAFVAGVDITQMGKRQLASGSACISGAEIFEALSHFVQQKYRLKTYQTPILVGYSSGATLVYATLAQAPVGTFKGAVALGFCPDLEWRKPMCKGEGLERDPAKVGFIYRPAPKIRDPFIALQGDQDQVCNPPKTREFIDRIPAAEVMMLPKVGHGYSVEKNWLPQFMQAYRKVAEAPGAVPPAPAPTAGTSAVAGVGDLPLVEVAARGDQRDLFAIMLSGDGGWAGLDREVADAIAARGVPVVGWDSLRYFWNARTPEGASRDLDRVIRHYADAWHKSAVLLIGYSQGADTMPFMVNRLAAETRRLVKATALIAVSKEAFFEFHVTHWLGQPTGGLPTLPELQKASMGPLLCVYGADEKDSPCLGLKGEGVRKMLLPGGHHFNGDYGGVAQSILSALPP